MADSHIVPQALVAQLRPSCRMKKIERPERASRYADAPTLGREIDLRMGTSRVIGYSVQCVATARSPHATMGESVVSSIRWCPRTSCSCADRAQHKRIVDGSGRLGNARGDGIRVQHVRRGDGQSARGRSSSACPKIQECPCRDAIC